jgi:hypothetical protein
MRDVEEGRMGDVEEGDDNVPAAPVDLCVFLSFRSGDNNVPAEWDVEEGDNNVQAAPVETRNVETRNVVPAAPVETRNDALNDLDLANLRPGDSISPQQLEALQNLEPKIASKLRSYAEDWSKDPRYSAALWRADDPGVNRLIGLWGYAVPIIYVFAVFTFTFWGFILNITDEYDNLTSETKNASAIPTMARWAFCGSSASAGFFQYLGPVSWGFLYLFCALPVLWIRGLGDTFLANKHYFALDNDWTLVKALLDEKDVPVTATSWPHAQLVEIRRREEFQAWLVLYGSGVTVLFSGSFVEAIINMLAIQFLAECDEFALRNFLSHDCTLFHGGTPQRTPLSKEQYENTWNLNETELGTPPLAPESKCASVCLMALWILFGIVGLPIAVVGLLMLVVLGIISLLLGFRLEAMGGSVPVWELRWCGIILWESLGGFGLW